MTSLVARLSLSTNPRSACTTPTKCTTALKHYQMSAWQSHRSLSTSVSLAANVQANKKKAGGKKKKGKADEPDPRIRNLKISMPRKTPAPLRFARNRALRHWTIHRAWLLWQRKERERQEKELMQIYQSMFNACEELRKTSGPGALDEGYLYRVAMEKTGIYGRQGFPIEYARALTETPAREPWNHEWTR